MAPLGGAVAESRSQLGGEARRMAGTAGRSRCRRMIRDYLVSAAIIFAIGPGGFPYGRGFPYGVVRSHTRDLGPVIEAGGDKLLGRPSGIGDISCISEEDSKIDEILFKRLVIKF